MAKSHKNSGIAQLLTIIGSILVIIVGVMSLLGRSFSVLGKAGGNIGLDSIVWAILAIIVGVITLGTTGVIKPIAKVGFNAVALIILGILCLWFFDMLGGILILIAGIILLL